MSSEGSSTSKVQSEEMITNEPSSSSQQTPTPTSPNSPTSTKQNNNNNNSNNNKHTTTAVSAAANLDPASLAAIDLHRNASSSSSKTSKRNSNKKKWSPFLQPSTPLPGGNVQKVALVTATTTSPPLLSGVAPPPGARVVYLRTLDSPTATSTINNNNNNKNHQSLSQQQQQPQQQSQNSSTLDDEYDEISSRVEDMNQLQRRHNARGVPGVGSPTSRSIALNLNNFKNSSSSKSNNNNSDRHLGNNSSKSINNNSTNFSRNSYYIRHDPYSKNSFLSQADTLPSSSSPPASPASPGFTLRRAAIPLKEKFILNPWQKLRYYKRVPFKILVNISIIVCLFVFIYGYYVDQAAVLRNERFGLVQFFLPNAADNTAQSLQQTFHKIDDVVDWIQSSAQAYFTIPDESCGIWMHFADLERGGSDDGDGSHQHNETEAKYIIRPPRLTIRLVKNYTQLYPSPKRLPDGSIDENYEVLDAWSYFGGGNEKKDETTEILTFDLNGSTNFIGPFDPAVLVNYQNEDAEYKKLHLHKACYPVRTDTPSGAYLPCRGATNRTDFFDRILDMTLDMSIRGVRRVSSTDLASVVRWDMTFRVGFDANRAVATVTADFKPYATNHFYTLPLIVLSVLIVLFAGSFVLYVRALWRYRRSNSQLEEIVKDLTEKEKIQFKEKLAGFFWRVFGVFSSSIGIIFCFLATAVMSSKTNDEDLAFWRDLFLGGTFFCQCCLILSNIQTIPAYYSGIKTVAYAIPLLFQFTVGIFPMFMGFSILFFVCFGPFAPVQFGSISRAMCALYSASNGDSLLQFYTQIDQAEHAVMKGFSRVCFTIFLIFFCGHAQNVIMGIVQDSYLRVNDTFELNYWDDEKSDSSSSSSSSSSSCSSSSSSSTSSDEDEATGDGVRVGQGETGSKNESSSSHSSRCKRRKERRQRKKQFNDLSDPIVVSKLASKLKRMKKERKSVMQSINQYYYVYDGHGGEGIDHHEQ